MKAAVMEGVRQPLVVRDLPMPELPPHGALLRIEACGICRSDWHAWTGDWSWFGVHLQFPHVLGHEFAGVVEAVGPEVTRIRTGDRVVAPFSQGEGSCDWCRRGLPNLCDTPLTPGIAYRGGFGRYVASPHADVNLVPLPESVDFVSAAALGCRFMTAFHGLVSRAQVTAGEWVVVFGCGGAGLSAVHIAHALGASVIAVDLDDAKLAMARQLGASAVVHAGREVAVKTVRSLTGGGAHVAVDALGIAETCRSAVLSLRKRGRHLQIGMTSAAEKGEIALPIDLIVLKELQILGTSGMPAPEFPTLLRMIERGQLTPGALVTREVELTRAGDVLVEMDSFSTLGVTVINDYGDD